METLPRARASPVSRFQLISSAKTKKSSPLRDALPSGVDGFVLIGVSYGLIGLEHQIAVAINPNGRG